MSTGEHTPELIIQLRDAVVQTHSLRPGVLVIGRIPGNDIVLTHPLVARRHAELRIEERGVLVVDLDSASGTFLNGARLLPNQPTLLTNGAVLQIGPFSLFVRLAPVDPDAPPLEAPPPPPMLAAQPITPLPLQPRPTYPAGRARGPSSRYLTDLPAIYHDADFLGRFLLIFESIIEPIQQRQDHIEYYFSPKTCPDPFINWLASWLGLTPPSAVGEAQRRRLVQEAMDLYQWRGTRYGLAHMIELSTGLPAEISDEPGQNAVIRIRVRLPVDYGVDRATIDEVIRLHKPAHVGYILDVRP
jgi:phage tail-like protein